MHVRGRPEGECRSSFGIYEGIHRLGLGEVVTGVLFSITELDLCCVIVYFNIIMTTSTYAIYISNNFFYACCKDNLLHRRYCLLDDDDEYYNVYIHIYSVQIHLLMTLVLLFAFL